MVGERKAERGMSNIKVSDFQIMYYLLWGRIYLIRDGKANNRSQGLPINGSGNRKITKQGRSQRAHFKAHYPICEDSRANRVI